MVHNIHNGIIEYLFFSVIKSQTLIVLEVISTKKLKINASILGGTRNIRRQEIFSGVY